MLLIARRAAATGRGVVLVIAMLVVLLLSGVGSAAADPTPGPSAPSPVIPSPLPGIYGPGFSPDSSVPPPGAPIPGQDEPGKQDPGKQDPGFFDIPGQIEKAIDTWFGHLVKQALEPVLRLLGTTLLASPNLTDGRITQIWDGVLVTANTVYVLFVLVGGLTVMGHETVQSRYAIKEIIPRLVIGVIASNASLWLINQLIGIGNALSAALLTGPVSAQGVGNVLTSTLTDNVLLFGAGNLFMLLVGLAIAVLGVALLITYLIRSAVLIVLTAGSPLAFVCHALPWTEGVAKLWWRAIIGCVAIQVLQALVLITSIRIFFDPQATNVFGLPTGGGLRDLLICLCLFVVLLKIPGWVQRVVLGRSPFHTSMVGRMARAFIYYRTWGLMRHGFRFSGRGGAATSSRSGPPPSSGGAVALVTGPRPGGGGGGLGGWRPRPPTMTATQEPPPDTPPGTAPQPPRSPGPTPLPPPGPVRRPPALSPGRSARLDQRHRATVASPPARGEQAPLFPAPVPPRPAPRPPTPQGARERGRQHR